MEHDDDRVELEVRAVYFGDLPDGEGLLAAVAVRPDGSGFGLQLSRAATWDAQDRALGMDTYCISTSEGPTHYGGVVRASPGPGLLDLDLIDDAAAALGVPVRFRLRLVVDARKATDFNSGVMRLLGL